MSLLDIPRRIRITITGVVQGVGFRPYVYALAQELGLAGFVRNDAAGICIEVEGLPEHLERFAERLQAPPPLARIETVERSDISPRGNAGFAILASEGEGRRTVLIAPDVATCADCERELFDPEDRRYRYPFINCTNCGPRYTIIRAAPYDRAHTTMADFAMCPDCQREYDDLTDRRFHAQPTCCPVCGPQVWLNENGCNPADSDDAVRAAIDLLAQGRILAVKGLGGFHLACDARNPEAVADLRRRKQRDAKPFAVMARDMDAARSLVRLDAAAEALLTGPERPIVLAKKGEGHGLAAGVAPRSADFGVMLPYTPLHLLLFDAAPYDVLVMTSGNVASEPIAQTNEDALERLAELADAFLLHDRPIHIRCDDSVVRVAQGRPCFLRRSRGYAPYPIRLRHAPQDACVLAVGAELSNTVCLTRDGQAFLSHHIGDLENPRAYDAFLQAVDHLADLLDVTPQAVVLDAHPGYRSTRYAKACGMPSIRVQHHHAHIASVLAEHGRNERVLGAAFDGLGWGEDDRLWGGEFLVADLDMCERFGYLSPVPQPGGDAAAKHPDRMAYAFLHAAYEEKADALCAELLPGLEPHRAVIRGMIEAGLNCPVTTSMGRLFDAVAALLGICTENTFHAQAPMELEAAASEFTGETKPFAYTFRQTDNGLWVLDTPGLVRQLAEAFLAGAPAAQCAARFHEAIARATLDMFRRMRDNTGVNTTALSGGVFANALLTARTEALLEAGGFEVLLNHDAPPGDGGIALGQAAVGTRRLQCA